MISCHITNMSIFDLKAGVQGVCKTHYIISEDVKAERIVVTKSKDLNNCQERIIKDLGLAYLETLVSKTRSLSLDLIMLGQIHFLKTFYSYTYSKQRA